MPRPLCKRFRSTRLRNGAYVVRRARQVPHVSAETAGKLLATLEEFGVAPETYRRIHGGGSTDLRKAEKYIVVMRAFWRRHGAGLVGLDRAIIFSIVQQNRGGKP